MKKRSSGTCVFVALASTIVGVIVAVLITIVISGAGSVSLDKEGEQIVLRAASLLYEDDAEKVADMAQERIENGVYSVGDFVISVMTDSDYLMRDIDDTEFAQDLCTVLYGNDFEQQDVDDLVENLTNKSRMYIVSRSLSEIDSSYKASSLVLDEKGSSVSGCEISSYPGNDEGYTIGIRQIVGSYVSDGTEVRTDFFVDGTLYQGYLVSSESEASGNVDRDFTISWDTTGVTEGTHEVNLLVRSSDGRGRVLTGGNITVPHCLTLVNDGVQISSILPNENSSWYMLDAQDRNAYVNILDATADVGVTLYDVYGNEIGHNDTPDSEYEVLRAMAQDMESVATATGIADVSNVFYIRVDRAGEDISLEEELFFTAVQSKNVAIYDGQYMAVATELDSAIPTVVPVEGINTTLAQTNIDLVDVNGDIETVNYEDATFLPLNGFLSEFRVTNATNGEYIDIFPEFDIGTVDYAYYTEQTSSITVNASAVEGYAANVTITNLSNDVSREATQGEVIALIPGENRILVTVKSFDGTINGYTLYILNGDDAGSFAEDTLSQFPTSYYSGLWLLHSIHPTYVFRAYNTGLDYYEVLDSENSGSRSLANVYTQPGWVVSSSPVYDGGGWMMATTETVNYFLDPRSFLTPENIFQFEMLSFDSSAQTVDGVRNIIEGSFMDTTSPDYAQIIYDAGQTANVSPYFLASRILQEMGYNGESDLCHGTLEGYEGYYNFYNIGSTPDPDIENGALINGARYAQWGKDPDEEEITAEEAELMLPWDSVEDAITGGALWIASRYTSAGQNTLYFQKFDVINNEDGLYEHQYAQNISMAYTEGQRYFEGYASIGMVDNSFTFLIPVYSNMPEEFGTMPDTE